MELLTRSSQSDERAPAPLHSLTTRQRALVEAIDQVQQATGEACSVRYLARRMRLHHSTIQEHLAALHRKGWLRSPDAPAFLRRRPE